MNTAQLPEVLSVKEAATFLREHPDTIYDRLRRGELHGVQYVKNGRWWITRDDIENFLNPGAHTRRTA